MPDADHESETTTTTTSTSSKPKQHQQQQLPTIEPLVPDASVKLFFQSTDDFVLCQPHLMPLKSVTLQKLEQMHSDAQQQLKETRAKTAADAANSNDQSEAEDRDFGDSKAEADRFERAEFN